MSSNSKATISFRLASKERLALDALASSMDRNRSDLIGDAIKNYIDVQRWQIDEIAHAMGEADKKDFASDRDVQKLFAELTK